MRRVLKYIICLILLLLLRGDSNLYCQNIIEYKGDTLITITPQNLATINSIIVERDYLEEELYVLSELNDLKDSTILEQESIIKFGQDQLRVAEEKHSLEIQKEAYTWRRRVYTWSGISAGIGLVLGILVAK